MNHDTPDPARAANRLINETSPYLLQHAYNPVDWYPWSDAAFAEAQNRHRPVFLSVGYSACHWCHVMERESFEDPGIAAILNTHFVCIKVDREERPDLDDLYMTAVQLMTGQGGWPMSVFLTPDKQPFYGGTYFPPENRYGRVGFKTLITRIAELWRDRESELRASAGQCTQAIQSQVSRSHPDSGTDCADVVDRAVRYLSETFDPVWGGFGEAPKFPPSAALQLCLRVEQRTKDAALRHVVCHTLDHMAAGGLYDHIGGGFHRYAVDEQWRVPHFEKMLYDNARLASTYIEAWQATGKADYRRVACDTLDYVLRDMTHPEGGFYASEDADSEGHEGRYYVWTESELHAALGPEAGAQAAAYWGVTPEGNFEGATIVHTTRSGTERPPEVDAWRARLLAVRSARVRPAVDDKIIASWNGLMISALARAAWAFGDAQYGLAAEKAARFVCEKMREGDRLYRSWRQGQARQPGFLDDYAFLAQGCLDCYMATGDAAWADMADSLTSTLWETFHDPEGADFFSSSSVWHPDALLRVKPVFDGAEPSGNAVAAQVMWRLGALIDEPVWGDRAERLLRAHAGRMEQLPQGALVMLAVWHDASAPPEDVVFAGLQGAPWSEPLCRPVGERYAPHRSVAYADPHSAWPRWKNLPPAAPEAGRSTAMLCRNRACHPPVSEPDALRRLLDAPA